MAYAFITYDAPHLKTDQVLTRWAARTSPERLRECRLFLLPFEARAQRSPLFEHRPVQHGGAHPKDVAEALGIPWLRLGAVQEMSRGWTACVVLGAGILPQELVDNERIINAHPGLIPWSRGLDSFKWAIHDGRKAGVTLHCLTAEVDMGEILERRVTLVAHSDNLDTFARRHYEAEIDLLSHFDAYLDVVPEAIERDDVGAVTRRMPVDRERSLSERFEQYRARYANSPDQLRVAP